jgi:putative spermidine/putrescine transport system substrate-binding protein
LIHRTPRPRTRGARLAALGVLGAFALAACSTAGATVPLSSASPGGTAASGSSWDQVLADARGQEVSLWMWGGDEKGNAYVDKVLAPAAAKLGVTVRRVPIANTADAVNRILSEHQAGKSHGGAVDLVWVNGDNFRTGQQAGVWACGWAGQLPNARYLDPTDPLLLSDFGTPVNGCESPWHKAQFVLAYNSAEVPNPPTTIPALFDWAKAHPGRFTYPAPPDFTGSAFLREALYASAGGPSHVPATYSQAAAATVTLALWTELKNLAPSLWRGGSTYPRDIDQLNSLYAGDQVSFTMTYGPATLDALVANGTFPASTKVLSLAGGTLGNASFLAIPADAAHTAGAEVVANLALSPEQQLAKAEPSVWGQYTVLDLSRVPADIAKRFAALPSSSVVPPFSVLSRNAQPELAAAWVTPLDQGWRTSVLAGG